MPVKYTKELLEPIVKESLSWAEVCRRLKIKPATGAQSHLTRRAKALGVDSTHFTGQLWSKGKQLPCKKAIESYLVNEKQVNSHVLKLRLIRENLKEAKCEICELTHWQNAPIVLELDHKNSKHDDNRLENLQILCPNCHAWETRKRKSRCGETGNTRTP